MRTSISIPADLKRRMDKVKNVVWSHVAAEAFEAKLREVEQKKKEQAMQTDMDKVAERLRKAAADEGGEAEAAGVKAGREWAKDRATPKQLQRLAQLPDEFFDGEPEAPLSMLEALASVVVDPSVDTSSAMACLWIDDEDEQRYCNDADFCRGFKMGAVEVWEAVQGKI